VAGPRLHGASFQFRFDAVIFCLCVIGFGFGEFSVRRSLGSFPEKIWGFANLFPQLGMIAIVLGQFFARFSEAPASRTYPILKELRSELDTKPTEYPPSLDTRVLQNGGFLTFKLGRQSDATARPVVRRERRKGLLDLRR
jgi:hypothetical protein